MKSIAMRCGIMPTSCLLSSRWRQKVFSVGPREYVWLDVFLAAMLRGEWRQFERQLVEGLACLAAAARPAGRVARRSPDRGSRERVSLRTRPDRQRRDHRWLDRAGLTFDAWTDYLVRRLLHDRWRDRLDGLLAAAPGPGEQSRTSTLPPKDSVRAPSIGSCGCWRAVPRPAWGIEDALDDGTPEVEPRAGRSPPDRARRLAGALPAGEVSERVMHLARLESAFHARARAAATADALASQLARHRLEWTRVDLERVSFETADAAREAVCCVRDDGLTLSEVAIESRQPVRDTRDLLERLEPELRDVVLGAGVDELVGPVAVGSRHEVVWVVGKRPADLADPLVRARAEAAVVDQMVARAILTHVRWAERPRVVRPSPPELVDASRAPTE